MTKLLGLPFLASKHGADVDLLIIYLHWLMIVLFVGWMAYFVYAIFRFRKARNPKASYVGAKSHASTYIEGAVALVEAILLLGLAIPMWSRAVDQFPKDNESTVMRVIAEQFAWNARYPGPDGVFGKQDMKLISAANPLGIDPNDPNGKDDVDPRTANEMYAPVNKHVIAHISSKDVIHSFKINPLRITQDAIPGMSIPLHFFPTYEGKYLINCAQLCGNSHYFMKGYFHIVSQAKYDQWLSEKSKAPATTGGFE